MVVKNISVEEKRQDNTEIVGDEELDLVVEDEEVVENDAGRRLCKMG